MIVDDIDKLFKYLVNFSQCGDKFYISGILGNGSFFEKLPVVIEDNNRCPSDIDEPDYVKRIKELEIISKKGFIDRTKYILSHRKDKAARIDIRLIRRQKFHLDYKQVRAWYNFDKTMVSLHVKVENSNIPLNITFCPHIDKFWNDYNLNIQIDPLITELRDSKGNVIYESKYNYMKEELQQQFRIRRLSNIIETYIDNYRYRRVDEIDKNEAIRFAVEIIMASKFISATAYSAFKPYSICYVNKQLSDIECGYIVDYIGPEAEIFEDLNGVDEVSIDGKILLNPANECKTLELYFSSYDDIVRIIELAQEKAFISINMNDKQKILTQRIN